MNFLNPWLLGGAAACLIPLALHLLNRTLVRQIDWAAVQFLENTETQRSSRRVPEHLLLLLIRMAIPILLAICLARPVMTSFRQPAGSGPAAVAFVVDNSLSMRARSENGMSRYEAALTNMRRISQQHPNATKALFLTASNEIDTNLDNIESAKESRLPEVTAFSSPPAEPFDLPNHPYTAIDAAIESVQQQAAPFRRIIVLSDFQKSDWLAPSAKSNLQAINSRLSADSILLSLASVPAATKRTLQSENLSITLASLASETVPAERAMQVIAKVSNHGQETRSTTVTLTVDEQQIASATLSVPAGTTSETPFAFAVEKLGWTTIHVALDTVDALPDDNAATAVVKIGPRRNALVMTSDSSNASANYIATALAPFEGVSSKAQNLFSVTQKPWRDVLEQEVESASILAFTDAENFSEADAARITYFISRGGVAIFFPPEAGSAESWIGLDHVLPMQYGDLFTIEPNPSNGVLMPPMKEPIFASLRTAVSDGLAAVTVKRIVTMTETANRSADAGTRSSDPTTNYLQLASGEPLLVGSPFGSGYVVQSATGLDSRWSNLALRPAFVPIVQTIANFACSRNQQRHNLGTYRPADLLKREHHQIQTVWRPPNRNTPQIAPEHIELSHLAGVFSVTEVENTELYALSLPESESSLTTLTPQELTQLASQMGAKILASDVTEQQIQFEAQHGREVWPWILCFLLGCFAAESFLAARIPAKVQQ